MHGLDETAGNRKPKTGAGADVIALLRAIKLVEYAFEFRRRNTVAFVQNLQRDASLIPYSPIEMVVPGGAYLAALSRRLNSTCSNNTASSSSIGSSGLNSSDTL